MKNMQYDSERLKPWILILPLAWAFWLAGCGNANLERQKAQQAQELEKLRDENKQVQKLRAENKELPRLRLDHEELPKLRETTNEITRIRQENDRIRGEIGALTKSRAERLQAAQQARQAAASAPGTPGAIPTAAAGINVTNVDDPNIPRDGDEIMIDPRFLAKLLPQFDWSKLERKEPIAVRALLEQQGIILTNYQQLISLGVTNYVIQHGPKPPPPAVPVPR